MTLACTTTKKEKKGSTVTNMDNAPSAGAQWRAPKMHGLSINHTKTHTYVRIYIQTYIHTYIRIYSYMVSCACN